MRWIRGQPWLRRWWSTKMWNWKIKHITKLFPSVLWCCWLGDRNGVRPVRKTWALVWHFNCTSYNSSSCHHSPPPSSLAPIKIKNGDILDRLTWKMAVKMGETFVVGQINSLSCCDWVWRGGHTVSGTRHNTRGRHCCALGLEMRRARPLIVASTNQRLTDWPAERRCISRPVWKTVPATSRRQLSWRPTGCDSWRISAAFASGTDPVKHINTHTKSTSMNRTVRRPDGNTGLKMSTHRVLFSLPIISVVLYIDVQ